MADEPTPVEDPPNNPVVDPPPVTEPDPPVDLPKEPSHDSRPGFVDEIMNHIDKAVAGIKSEVPALDPVIDPDPSPVKPPWTARKLFGK